MKLLLDMNLSPAWEAVFRAAGLDFADALHLANSQSAERLKTFDGRFIKRARNLSECVVEEP